MADSHETRESVFASTSRIQPRQSSASGLYTTSNDSALSLTIPGDLKSVERTSIAPMDSSSDSTSGVRSYESKQRFWDRVRKSRGKRSNRFMRDSNGRAGPFGIDICTRKTFRNIVRFSYLAAACAFTSIITLYYSSASTYSAFDMAFGAFAHPDGFPLDVQSPFYPTTYLRSVLPIPCHSHNDQWRHTPLHAALGTGCISIEADIWASPDPDKHEIFVGHDRGALLPDRTLQNMYIQPLMNILALHNQEPLSTKAIVDARRRRDEAAHEPKGKANGVFALSPATSLTLLLDFKSASEEIFPALQTAIQPLIQKNWLTYWDGDLGMRVERPITVVASGDADFELILRGGNASADASTDITRYIFYDAPLDGLVQHGDPDALPIKQVISIDLEHVAEGEAKMKKLQDNTSASRLLRYRYNPSNSHLASTSLAKTIGAISPILSHPDSAQRKVIRKQIRAARNRGLISRYWGTPRWPRGLRDNVWESLESEGVGLLSVDDLRGVRKGEWGSGTRGGRFWGRKRGDKMDWLPETEQ